MEIQDHEGQFRVNPTVLPDDRNLFVLVGANNSGKSTILRSVTKTFADESFRVDVNRTLLNGEGSHDKTYRKSLIAFENQVRNYSDDNTQRPIQTLQDFFNLKDADRAPIIAWYNKYFPNTIREEREDPENTASPLLLKVGEHSITKQGSGMRSTLEIFIRLFDPKIKILCIDEPELGLEPTLQKYLFRAIKEKAVEAGKVVILATHSHHFLDQEEIGNNYVCSRATDGKIELVQAADLKSIIFRLLGNTLSSVLLPERILILEGPSDTTFIKKCLLLLRKDSFAIHGSGGIGNVSYAISAITQFLRFNDNLPAYNGNVFVIVDKPTRDIVIREWRRLLADEGQLQVLPLNGIEYYYPERILQNIFDTADAKNTIVNGYLAANPNAYNGVAISKNMLAQKAAELLQEADLGEANNELLAFLAQLP